MHQWTSAELLGAYKTKVEATLRLFMDAMLHSVLPEGESLEDYKKRHKVNVTVEQLRDGCIFTLVVDGASIGVLEYDDGCIYVELDYAPYLGKNTPKS